MEEPVNDGTFEPGSDPQGDSPGEPRAEPLPEAVTEAISAPPVWRPAFERERNRRRALLRRLAALLGTGTVAFAFTTWLLLQRESRSSRGSVSLVAAPAAPGGSDKAQPGGESGEQNAEAQALSAARAQLEALNQDDITAAYSHFSPRYRARVPLATFRRLVVAHHDMFHTEEQTVSTRSTSEDRVVLDIHLSSDDDEDYIAEFTLVRLQGKWCVDDLRWALDQNDTHSSA